MKRIFQALPLLFCGMLHAQENTHTKAHDVPEEQPLNTTVLGDINGDKVIDTAFVYTPPLLNQTNEFSYTFGCKDSVCYNRVTFSCKVPDLVIEDSVWGRVAAVDDIDGDGFRELLFNPGRFIGGIVTGLYLYHFNGIDWQLIENVVVRGWLGEGDFSISNVFYKKGKHYYLKGIALKEGDEVPDIKEIKIKNK